jgi:hypothetical protein
MRKILLVVWTAASIIGLLIGVGVAIPSGTESRARVEPSITGQTAKSMAGFSALPTVTRNCSSVTCNFYFSRSETGRIHRQIETNGYKAAAMSGLICSATGPGAPACAAGLAIHAGSIQKNVKGAAGRHGCFVLRFNKIGAALGAASPAAISFYNVAGTHRFCRA